MLKYFIVGFGFVLIGYRLYNHVNNKLEKINLEFDDL